MKKSLLIGCGLVLFVLYLGFGGGAEALVEFIMDLMGVSL